MDDNGLICYSLLDFCIYNYADKNTIITDSDLCVTRRKQKLKSQIPSNCFSRFKDLFWRCQNFLLNIVIGGDNKLSENK